MADAQPAPVDESTYRLPRTVVPRRYELTIEPDLDAATFTGREAVEIELTEAVDEIVLNAAELEIDDAWLEAEGGRTDLDVHLDPDTERLHLGLPGPAGPGEAVLHVSFRGVLNDQLRGFYRSTFVDGDGSTRVIGTTQFEATDARRAFPCWDEPDRKAAFAVTLVVADDLLAVSNTAPVREEPAGSGRRAVTFADTIPMSTYLVAFVVGPLEVTEAVDVDGVPLRVVHPPGKGHLTAYPLEVGAFCLRWFSDYYGLPYPGDKLDLIALPDFAAGAMENLGAITFREALLLIDPAAVTQAELQRVADVVAHEIAHMWFGDLVTMRWWNGLWLNEAFATFMELAACDAYRPEWQRWVAFSRERAGAFEVDSLESTRPIEYPVYSPHDADGMFDVLTYQKGGSVLRMLEQYLGEPRFREGIRHYLKTRQLGNAETTDLFDDIEAATGEPVRRIMDSWVFQGGHPLVTVAAGEGTRIVVSQQRFTYAGGGAAGATAGDGSWAIPLLVRRAGGEAVPVLLDTARTEIDLPGTGPVVANAGGHGFYRVRYEGELFAALGDRALEVLEPVERAQLVDDTWAAVLAGHVAAQDFLTLAGRLAGERHRTVWAALLEGLGQLDHILDGDARAALQETVRGLVGPVLADLGWAPAPDEDELTRQLRGTLIQAAGILGDDADVQSAARDALRRHQDAPGSVDPDVAAAALRVVAHAGGAADHEAFVERFRTSESPQEQLRYLYALALFDDDELVARTLAMALDEVRTQNAPFLLLALLQGRRSGPPTWRFVCEHWDEINQRFPASSVPRMLGGVTRLSQPEQAAAVEAFLAEHDVPQGRLQVRQHLERLRVNVALRQREAGRLADALAG